MSLVYLDTVGLIALWDQSDQWHLAAEAAMARLVAEKYRFFSSEFVMLECGNTAARRPFRDSVAGGTDRAKALQHQSKLTDKTLFTEFGQVVGTLQYMSPEQASNA